MVNCAIISKAEIKVFVIYFFTLGPLTIFLKMLFWALDVASPIVFKKKIGILAYYRADCYGVKIADETYCTITIGEI